MNTYYRTLTREELIEIKKLERENLSLESDLYEYFENPTEKLNDIKHYCKCGFLNYFKKNDLNKFKSFKGIKTFIENKIEENWEKWEEIEYCGLQGE